MTRREQIDRLAFALVQIRAEVGRIMDDPNYKTLGDDAKLAANGIVVNLDTHVKAVLKSLQE